jgi:DNA-directed RNA polymerase specialized sigma24 family protein
MEKTMEVYRKMARVMSGDVDTKNLDYQECLQEVVTKILEDKTEPENPEHYIRKAVSNMLKNRYKTEQRLDYGFADNGAIVGPDTKLIDIKHALESVLDGRQLALVDMYAQGHTLQEMADELEYSNLMSCQRELKKAYNKIDKLKLSYLYDAKYASYQPRRARSKYDEVPEADSGVIRRKYQCLETKAVTVRPFRSDALRVATVKMVKLDSQLDVAGNTSTSYDIRETNYCTELIRNTEYRQLMKNRADVHRSTHQPEMVERPRMATFANNHFVSTCGRFLDLS